MTDRDQGAWRAQRGVRFAQWQSSHSGVTAHVADFKSKTAALVASHKAAVQAQAQEQRAARLAKSRALTAGERKHVQDLMQKAAYLTKSGDMVAAASILRQVLDLDPANGDANFALGDCFQRQGNLVDAAEYFSRAATLPDDSLDTVNGYFNAMLVLQNLPPPRDPNIDDPPVIFRVPDAPAEVWDAPDAPVMTIIPAGEYTMGSPQTEQNHQASETLHRVAIHYPLAVGKCDVTRGEFAAFVEDTGYDARGDKGSYVYIDGKFRRDLNADWRSPGFDQSDDDPVVCINYHDGIAYAAWLSAKTGHTYRLPSEAEWEYAVRGGTTTMYYWGDDIGTGHANCDGCGGPASVGKPSCGGMYPPNGFGLYDVVGNVWKWLADCWNPTYIGAPTDGSAWETGNCTLRGRRGGSWFNVAHARPGDVRAPFRLRSAARFGSIPEIRYSSFGLRVVRNL